VLSFHKRIPPEEFCPYTQEAGWWFQKIRTLFYELCAY
jgi:hypothetical protein